MLGVKRDRYKEGYLRKVDRAKGWAWEFRVRVDGKVQYMTLSGAEFPTEKAAKVKLQGLLLKVNEGKVGNLVEAVMFGTLLDRYLAEELPAKASSQGSYTSLIRTWIRPKWGDVALTDMKANAIRTWLLSLPLSSLSKGHIRSLLHKLFDLAMLWEFIPVGRNPVELVKIKGVTKREKEPVILTPEQAMAVIASMPSPYSLMTLTVAALGLRLSEMLGLQWGDFDFTKGSVTIQRNAYRGTIEETKTKSSKAILPLSSELAALLLVWRESLAKEREDEKESPWVFPNPATGLPYLGPSIQQRWLRPAGESIGVKGLGFHSLRHSHKVWLDSLGTPMGVMKDLLRHSAISTTMNVYGATLSDAKREYNQKVTGLLFPTP